jgi:hypothetical protein
VYSSLWLTENRDEWLAVRREGVEAHQSQRLPSATMLCQYAVNFDDVHFDAGRSRLSNATTARLQY